MSRVKTFQATGLAPDGRLYAGDLNDIQDHYADLSNFSQTHDVGTIRLGDTGLQIVKYGSGEFRMSGALRTDGLLRGLGGLIAGAFTDAQRDAIGSGLAPNGTIILNTTQNEIQWNSGTDGARVWKRVESTTVGSTPSARLVGEIIAWAGNIATLTGIQEPSSGWLLCNGAAVSRSTYAALYAICGTLYGAGDGSTTFNLPDFREGRSPIGKGLTDFTTRGAAGGAKTHTLVTGEIPAHAHTMQSGGSHSHTFGGSPAVVDSGGGSTQATTGADVRAGTGVSSSTNTTGSHTHTIDNAGGGGSHNNMQPYQVVGGYIIKY